MLAYTLLLLLLSLLLHTCRSTPLVPRSQGISVSPVSPQTAPASIIPGFNNSTAVVLLVALVSLALAIPMFVYIWLRRRRLLRGGRGAGAMVVERKMSMASMASDSPLNARRRSTDSGATGGSKESGPAIPKVVVEDTDPAEAEPKTPRTPKGPVRTETSSTTGTAMTLVARPVQISVKPIRAVEIMVKPAKSAREALFRVSASWEKLKG
ncbi:uncharacterized protein H6S33_007320 [Morchella sextelata]|uniref:uncharacterized protein n=1 Tax=Morchella sextelata TaxID=1174677 RepID=UPI001D055AEA|nr:uncharacterized protein H6S33_007320 [Morchella sextelata]KAH0603661.1 hypothetical protein H6S33_007320 [Morchella sextelata]